MAIKNRSEIKDTLRTNKRPNQGHFWDWVDSFWHKSDVIPTQIADGSIGSGKLDGSVTQLIDSRVLGADDEDLENNANVLSLKDRLPVGNRKGYVIIRQDFNFGSIPEAYANSIWEIRYSHDLNNQLIVLPENITLKFSGGYISNYASIEGNQTIIEGKGQLFDASGILSGSWDLQTIKSEWFISEVSSDDTINLQKSIDLAILIGGEIQGILSKTYNVSSLIIRNGLKVFDFQNSVIKGLGTAVNGVVKFEGEDVFNGINVENLTFSANFDMSLGDNIAVYLDNTKFCKFVNCSFYNFQNLSNLNHICIFGKNNCHNNIFTNNVFKCVDNPTLRGFGITLEGLPTSDYAGFFTNVYLEDSKFGKGNIISNNEFINGSYAINFLGSQFNIVSDNYCINQNHRTFYTGNAARKNIYNSNICLDYKSSAIVFSYNSNENVFSNNVCKTNSINGEAAININTGGFGNKIFNNFIDSPTNFGIYLAGDVSDTFVSGNSIKNHYVAGIAIDSDWVTPRPANAIFSRPNYGAPPVGNDWAFAGMKNITITNNTIGHGYLNRNTCGISIAQINSGDNFTLLEKIIIAKNQITSADNILFDFQMFYDDDSKIIDCVLEGNTFLYKNGVRAVSSSGLEELNNNSLLLLNNLGLPSANNLIEREILSNELNVLNVLSTEIVKIINNSSQNLTDIIGENGQQVTLRLDLNTTLIHNSGKIRLKGNIDATSSSNSFITLVKITNIWFETSRSF